MVEYWMRTAAERIMTEQWNPFGDIPAILKAAAEIIASEYEKSLSQQARKTSESSYRTDVPAGIGCNSTAVEQAGAKSEAHAPATPATPTQEELAEALRKAIELVWEHHEVGHIRRAYEQGAGSCELCKESRLLRIGEVLEKYDKRVAEAAPTTPPEWTWRVLQISQQVEEKRAKMRTLGQTIEARKLDDEIHFLEREIVNFVRNAALAGQGRKPSGESFSREAGTPPESAFRKGYLEREAGTQEKK